MESLSWFRSVYGRLALALGGRNARQPVARYCNRLVGYTVEEGVSGSGRVRTRRRSKKVRTGKRGAGPGRRARRKVEFALEWYFSSPQGPVRLTAHTGRWLGYTKITYDEYVLWTAAQLADARRKQDVVAFYARERRRYGRNSNPNTPCGRCGEDMPLLDPVPYRGQDVHPNYGQVRDGMWQVCMACSRELVSQNRSFR